MDGSVDNEVDARLIVSDHDAELTMAAAVSEVTVWDSDPTGTSEDDVAAAVT